jgi:hypothetical protein
MQSADAFSGSHGATFDEKLKNLFNAGQWNRGTGDAIRLGSAKRALALDAAKALATVSVGSESLCFVLASGALHTSILQPVVVVVNAQ